MDVTQGVAGAALGAADAAGHAANAVGRAADTVARIGRRGYRAGAWTMRQGRAINRRLEELGVAPADAARFIGRNAYEMGRSGVAVGTTAYRHAVEMARFLREQALQRQHDRNVHAHVAAGRAVGNLPAADA